MQLLRANKEVFSVQIKTEDLLTLFQKLVLERHDLHFPKIYTNKTKLFTLTLQVSFLFYVFSISFYFFLKSPINIGYS